MSSNGTGEDFNELKQRLVDKENELLGLKKLLSTSVVIGNNESEESLLKIKEKIRDMPADVLGVIRGIVLGEDRIDLVDGKRVK